MGKFAEFPTELDFLTDHGGGGLTWIGTYGPISRFEDGAEAGTAIMVRHGVPPMIVSRPMRGGHFGVLRFITVFDKADAAQVARVKAVNRELLAMCVEKGFVMYKTPRWAWQELAPRLDPAMLAMMQKVKDLLDPRGIMNPGRMGF
jgi:FAD/FMN-containing dehydrogenase